LKRVTEACNHYDLALQLPGLESSQRASLHKNLICAHNEQGKLEKEDALKMWHFDRSLEHTDKALYFGALSMDQGWVKDIIQKSGAKTLERIDKLLAFETFQIKADYMEKVFCRMNVANCDLLMRIAFQIAKVNMKQARTLYATW